MRNLEELIRDLRAGRDGVMAIALEGCRPQDATSKTFAVSVGVVDNGNVRLYLWYESVYLDSRHIPQVLKDIAEAGVCRARDESVGTGSPEVWIDGSDADGRDLAIGSFHVEPTRASLVSLTKIWEFMRAGWDGTMIRQECAIDVNGFWHPVIEKAA